MFLPVEHPMNKYVVNNCTNASGCRYLKWLYFYQLLVFLTRVEPGLNGQHNPKVKNSHESSLVFIIAMVSPELCRLPATN